MNIRSNLYGSKFINESSICTSLQLFKLKSKYTFGVYEKDLITGYQRYPNYIKSLEITKVNGKVNTYILNLVYPITQFDDPNYFEKVLSSVSGTRRIEFTYGDASMPNYIYKNEVGIITKTNSRFVEGAVIEYIR